MKNLLFYILGFLFLSFISCSGSDSNSASGHHKYAGTFVSENGIKFVLNEDSTTLITFGDSVTYESTWKVCSNDTMEWANIEFAGSQEYYYLHNEKLYRSRYNMDSDFMGFAITYQD